ncbi:hypothetical protein [Variovorax ginsengisoli]|uniref:Uncharacterized protein n=1 Tax=Variovorax ginsengisoli TaxID=363844 RepID=A0ABT8SF98_9BURK|nr:hypothetical protein [Variovorax ginsengisoli]MDN8617878.1 hypothetical protein [Variovorax ginsengisoli]MDO1537048.1 hypothetical protein [Variovorax ginsengisoli]
MRSLSGPTIAALGASTVPLVQLILLGFGTPIALNTSNWDFVWSGTTYKGAGGLGSVTTIEDSPGEIKGLNFTLSGLDSSYIALALDSVDVVQGTPITVRTAILDSTYAIVDAPVEWSGKLDTMSIIEDGETCSISVTAESSAVDLLRGSPLTYSDADQQALHAGDLAFQYVISQATTPVIWPSKEWLTFASVH